MFGLGEKKRPLPWYVFATIVVWVVVLSSISSIGTAAHFRAAEAVCAGFYLGMLAMYAAVHIYRWK